jgi:hypothetical protein
MTITDFNAKLAINSTKIISTMWCVYAFSILVALPVILPEWQPQLLYLSNCVQLVFLPLILVSGKLLNVSSENRASQDHETLMIELQEIKEIHSDIKQLISKGKFDA